MELPELPEASILFFRSPMLITRTPIRPPIPALRLFPIRLLMVTCLILPDLMGVPTDTNLIRMGMA